jgi:hypothetical protein
MLRRIFAAVGVVCLVGFVSAAPGWAQPNNGWRYNNFDREDPRAASQRAYDQSRSGGNSYGDYWYTYFQGPYVGGAVGSEEVTDFLRNAGQFTKNVPIPDFTPNPTATLSPSGTVAGGFVGFNQPVFTVFRAPVIVGFEGLFLGGSGSTSIPGIPGTFGPGGIATSAAAANDSTTVKFGGSTNLIGRIGTIIPVGNVPIMVSFDAGVSWLDVSLNLNCTGTGACGTNAIPAQTLFIHKMVTGSLIGAEVNVPLLPLFGVQPMGPPTGFAATTFGFQWLHGDYGTTQATLGNFAQIQITTNQHITNDVFLARVSVPLNPHVAFKVSQAWALGPIAASTPTIVWGGGAALAARCPACRSERRPLPARNGRRWAADQCPFSGVKQTSQTHGAMSANDPKRTWPAVVFAL